MKTIVVLFDSLRRDYLGCYPDVRLEGSMDKKVLTPNIDRFAKQAVVFERAYVNSHPTGPFRREAWTGKIEFPHRGWGPLLPTDLTFARLLGEAGVVSMLITDNYAITDGTYGIQSSYTVANPSHAGNYQQWFTGWHLVRGHQSDRWWPSNRKVELPCSPEKLRGGAHRMVLYLQENCGRRFECDWSVARVFQTAINWLEENYDRDSFCLWIDSFTPHEPYDPPRYYEEVYDPGYDGERVIFPNYGKTDFLSQRELQHIRAMYAGTVTMLDHWFGFFLEAVANMGLLKDTMIIVTGDHGHLLGDHGMIGKPGIAQGSDALLWEGIADIPLIIYHPEGEAGIRSQALVQAVDLFPTIMDHMKVQWPPDVDGRSLLGLVQGRQDKVRELGLYSRHKDTVNVTDGRYTLFLHHPDHHSGASRLYDLKHDPMQQRNIISQQPQLARELQSFAVQYLEQVDAVPFVLETAELGLQL